jgi:5-dehydro-2-deoxygluconokinase
MTEWPARHVLKLIANARSDARTPLPQRLPELRQVFGACQALGREVLVEALPQEDQTTDVFIESLYAAGFKPDYWLVELQHGDDAWKAIEAVVEAHDPHCRGLITIARNVQSGPDLAKASRQEKVIGFVGGRSVFGAALQLWFSGGIDDEAAVAMMCRQLEALAEPFFGRS